ncbi:glycine zipper 2TM domain-containing protein [Cetobacterium sp. 2A]|uniref:YMGG-like glycine zipper-containing protein n=1 Tax=unclassified Cetobacterium TaxID=2630983 RepID=UPI00163D0EA7|nr:YMGG-like glycine zipper-containing protein [Cetobacterium sp. 2A]MBC2854946.1 glycine zipper 2TM domain-containing protein [Cetobacterium sp. 2A]
MKKLAMGILLGLTLMGCSNLNTTEKSALVGAGVGALAGQAIGGNTAGTLIGAGVGALGGAAVGNYRSTGSVLGK